MSDSLWPHGLQHSRLLCPPLSPGVCSNSCPLSLWCYLTILCFVSPFSFCLQSFPATRSFQWVGSSHQVVKSIGDSASAIVLPMNIQGWFPLGLTGLNSLQLKRLSRVFPSTTIWKHHFFGTQPSSRSNCHIHTWLLEKPALWITALSWQRGFCNSMKLWAMPCRATQDGQVRVKSSDKMWSIGGGNGNSCVLV